MRPLHASGENTTSRRAQPSRVCTELKREMPKRLSSASNMVLFPAYWVAVGDSNISGSGLKRRRLQIRFLTTFSARNALFKLPQSLCSRKKSEFSRAALACFRTSIILASSSLSFSSSRILATTSSCVGFASNTCRNHQNQESRRNQRSVSYQDRRCEEDRDIIGFFSTVFSRGALLLTSVSHVIKQLASIMAYMVRGA